jgi:hypothetical protein
VGYGVATHRKGGGLCDWRKEMKVGKPAGPNWAERPGDMGRLQREGAQAVRRNGQK